MVTQDIFNWSRRHVFRNYSSWFSDDPLLLSVVFCYIWELHWDLVFSSPSTSLSTVCRSKSGSLFVPGFSVGLQGHLVQTEKKVPIVLHTVMQATVFCFVFFQLDWGLVWYKHATQDNADQHLIPFLHHWVEIKHDLPQQSQPSFPMCECSAASSCVYPWCAGTQWYQGLDNLPSDGAIFGLGSLPLNVPEEKEKWMEYSKGNEFKEW